jgi:hypothetical protein
MNDFYKQDVFFFVTTIAVVVVTIIVVIAAAYVIKILNDVRYIAKKAKTEADLLTEDLQDLRTNVRREGFKLKFLSSFFSSLYRKKK